MPWLQISIDTTEPQAPLLELLFENLGALSVTLGDAGDQPLLEPGPNETPLWSMTRVTALFEAERDLDELRSLISQALNRDASRGLRIEYLQDRAWERVWLEHFRPIRFGRRLWVTPEGQQPDTTDGVVVKLDPGLAFGTGTHPTTALCLEWLDSLELQDRTVIDYGCGSGILAIAALKLGAARAIAIDHDPQALIATRDNAQKNQVGERLTLYLPAEAPGEPVDLLVANILATPLIELAPLLCGLIKPNGRLALSGILREQQDQVAKAYEPYAEMQPPEYRGDWVRLSGSRR
jgi:ribosomal protein L11 methyltransferase